MLTVTTVKQYLYIPDGMVSDDQLISRFIDMAVSYLKGAVDDFDAKYEALEDFRKQADQYALFYVAELYQNRNQHGDASEPSYNVKALMMQLQTYEL